MSTPMTMFKLETMIYASEDGTSSVFTLNPDLQKQLAALAAQHPEMYCQKANAFIEAKKTQLNLHDLGQLWAYCKLCDPAEAFLLSSAGIGSLNKILNNLSRTDLLDFGDGRKIKKMQVAKWDITSNSIDFRTLVPRI